MLQGAMTSLLARLAASARPALSAAVTSLTAITSVTAVTSSSLSSCSAVSGLRLFSAAGRPAPLLRLTPALRRLAAPAPAAAAVPPGCRGISLETLHRRLQNPKRRIKKRPLDGNPQLKGVVLKTLIKKPKKPNSANRRCCLVRLSNGKEMVAYIPGEGHNLQEHNIVMVRVGRLRDVPGVKIKCIRGKYDLSHVVKKSQA